MLGEFSTWVASWTFHSIGTSECQNAKLGRDLLQGSAAWMLNRTFAKQAPFLYGLTSWTRLVTKREQGGRVSPRGAALMEFSRVTRFVH